MDAAERIADYLSDDLAPDEREAFEAELARDVALRAQLDAAVRADAALASLGPTELPDGFTDRLRAALDAELADVLAPAAADEPDPRVAAEVELGERDELAARRAARAVPRWVGGLAGAAAAVLVVVAGVAGLSSVSGGADEAPESADGGAGADASADMFETQEADEAEMEEEATEEAAGDEPAATGEGEAASDESTVTMRAIDQPTLLAEQRSLSEDQVDELLLTPTLTELAARQLPAADGEALAAEWADGWRTAADDPDAAQGVRVVGTVGPEDREAVAQCLADATESGRTEGIAAYAELADYEGQPVVVLGMVTLDTATDTWSVPAVQVLERASCEVLAARP